MGQKFTDVLFSKRQRLKALGAWLLACWCAGFSSSGLAASPSLNFIAPLEAEGIVERGGGGSGGKGGGSGECC